MTDHIKFRNTNEEGNVEVLDLWVEKRYDDGWVVGWCPQLKENIVVHPLNVLVELQEQV